MSEQKRYTSQKIREVADMFNSTTNPIAVCFCDNDGWHPNYVECHVEKMLRQAADAEEELATLKGDRNGLLKSNESLANDNDRLRGENAKLKARMEAVVKECESIKSHYEKVVLSQPPFTLVVEANRILRAARGEGGAE